VGKITGFMEFQRQEEDHLEPAARLKNYKEFTLTLTNDQAKVQGARCMDCGIPFCNTGCPVNNMIPDWNDLVYHGNYRNAVENTSTPPTTSPNSRAASVPRPARPPARSVSTTSRSASSRSSARSRTSAGKTAGSFRSRRL
jgi:hypothetical protein